MNGVKVVEGLAKVAWTKNQITRVGEQFNKLVMNTAKDNEMTGEEISKLKNFLKENDLDLQFLSQTADDGSLTNAYYRRPEHMLKGERLKKYKGPNKEVHELYNGAKDGIVVIDGNYDDRYTLTHEVGHALDRKRNPVLYRLKTNIGRDLQDSAPVYAAGGAGVGGYLAYDEGDTMNTAVNTAVNTGVAGAFGGGIAGVGGLLVNKGENNAWDYGEEILNYIHGPEEANRLIQDAAKQRELAKKTYTLNSLRLLKNTGIRAGLGAGAGLGLAALINRYRNEEADA
jgi:hypothetical protein